MPDTGTRTEPLFDIRAEAEVDATPDQVWAVVSDLTRSAEWSAECVGGTWISGTPATVGAVFRGENMRSRDVVGWAPVVRGRWFTESEIVAAEPGRRLSWAIRTRAGVRQDSVWTFEIEPLGTRSLLVHRFRMGRPTEGIREITEGMSDLERQRFFTEWADKLRREMAETVARAKDVVEKG